jgi:hypothetical protein
MTQQERVYEALRIAVAALGTIVRGDVADDAENEMECWDQFAERRLKQIQEVLKNG